MSAVRIFVSYAQPDRSLAEEVFEALRAMQVDVWSDDQLSAGENWSEVLRARLRDSEYFLLVLTPKTAESSWVLQELGAAWALDKRIIVVTSDRRLLARLPVDLTGGLAVSADELGKLEDIIQHPA